MSIGIIKPDVSHLKVFGCNVFVHVPDPKRKKLDKKSISCIFVGYPEGSKSYKVDNPNTTKFLRSNDVVFLETVSATSHLKEKRMPTC